MQILPFNVKYVLYELLTERLSFNFSNLINLYFLSFCYNNRLSEHFYSQLGLSFKSISKNSLKRVYKRVNSLYDNFSKLSIPSKYVSNYKNKIIKIIEKAHVSLKKVKINKKSSYSSKYIRLLDHFIYYKPKFNKS
jgi:hypothetical protein